MSTNDLLKAYRAAPKLSKGTFTRWNNFVVMVLQNFGMEHIIKQNVFNTTSTSPVDSKESLTSQTDINRDRGFRVAMTSIFPHQFYHLLEHKHTAKEMWDEIQD